DIPEGDCDCDGNQLDALGVCGGDCAGDVNDNGLCDDEEIGGCTDPMNPGFDPNATFDDGSCLIGGCLIVEACNYDETADYQLPGACEFESCAGCTDSMACNYDMDATIDNGSCEYPEEFYNCDGTCMNDGDGDGVCDELEVLGCTEEGNPVYDPSATEDDGSCLVAGCLLPFACNYDPTADYIVVELCDFASCVGCTDEEACNYDPTATLGSASACEYPAIPFLDCDGNCLNDSDEDGVCDEQEIPGCTDEAAVNFNPFATDDNGTCIVLQGGCVLPFACNYDAEADFYLPGSCDFSCLFGAGEGDCNNELACNYGATDEPCMFFDAEGNTCVPGGCTMTAACNYDADAAYNDGSCEFSTCQVFGCNVSTACNFNEDATVNDGSCDFASCFSNDVEGCTNPMACNFDGEATLNDGSCDFTSCADMGCTDANACNYDVTATINDGSCVMATTGYDCFGNCIADVDGDGVCDMDEVSGCTDMGANNYDPSATDNNGTCTYDTEGCMDVYACNFNYQATTDNGSCDFGCYGCMNANACNFNVDATLHDAEDCTFIMSHELQGAVDVVLEEATEYSYAFTAGSEYIWTVEGGVIVEGQGTSVVNVVWLLEEGVITVQEVNAEGCEGDLVSLIVTGAASGIEEASVAFTAFPNPANDVVVVNTTGFEAHAFQVLDAAGRVVISERLVAGRNVINVAHLANGTYRMVLDQSNGRAVKQLVIAH
ncbi:MAG: T9SS type A sorting domain-containing protein, partial [Bacteroidota bacterium]|nr:T9SS type A sorting domain-containing protein [Bacteroidota bacterium]